MGLGKAREELPELLSSNALNFVLMSHRPCVQKSNVPSSAKVLLFTSEQNGSLCRVPEKAGFQPRQMLYVVRAFFSALASLLLDAACYGETGPACPVTAAPALL